LDAIQVKLVQVVISDLIAVASSHLNPSADRIFVMARGSRYSANAAFFRKQRQAPENFRL
jgi:hypothetical protein